MAASGGFLRDYRGAVLAAFQYFLSHHLIIYPKLVAICEGLELAT